MQEREIHIPIKKEVIHGTLAAFEKAQGLILFVHGSGSHVTALGTVLWLKPCKRGDFPLYYSTY